MLDSDVTSLLTDDKKNISAEVAGGKDYINVETGIFTCVAVGYASVGMCKIILFHNYLFKWLIK